MRKGCVALRKTRKRIDDVECSKKEARLAAVTLEETPREACHDDGDDERTRLPSRVLELLLLRSRAPTNAGWLIVSTEGSEARDNPLTRGQGSLGGEGDAFCPCILC